MTPRKAVYLALRKQVKDTLGLLKDGDFYGAMVRVGFISPEPILDAYRYIDRSIIPDEAEREYRRIMKNELKGFGQYSADWLEILNDFIQRQTLSELSTLVTDTTKKNLLKIIEDSIASGQGIPQTAAEIEAAYKNMELLIFRSLRHRATTIARTETVRARGAAKTAAGDKSPFVMSKVWRSAQDARTRGAKPKDRADHLDMDMQTVDSDQPFVDPRSGAAMMYPGDVSLGATAADVVNCRCSVNMVPKRGEDGRVMRKPGMQLSLDTIYLKHH